MTRERLAEFKVDGYSKGELEAIIRQCGTIIEKQQRKIAQLDSVQDVPPSVIEALQGKLAEAERRGLLEREGRRNGVWN